MFCSQVAARKRHTMGLRSDDLAGILESEITSISWLKYPHEKDAPSDPQRIIKHFGSHRQAPRRSIEPVLQQNGR